MMRTGQGLCGLLLGAVCALQVGCADQPKEGGTKQVSPAIPAKGGDDKPVAKPEDKAEDKQKEPEKIGSTTGGGKETPATPSDGQ